MANFPTQYRGKKRIHMNPGNPVHMTYGGHYDEQGRVQLVEKGKENIYDFIQSHADSVDINVLLARYNNGDVSALSKTQGFYIDATQFPTNYAEALNQIERMRDSFMKLPVEVRSKFNHSFSEFLAASGSPDFMNMLQVDQQVPAETKEEVVNEQE